MVSGLLLLSVASGIENVIILRRTTFELEDEDEEPERQAASVVEERNLHFIASWRPNSWRAR